MNSQIRSMLDAKSFIKADEKTVPIIEWIPVIDSIKVELEFAEDRQLADFLGIAPSTLSECRSGRLNLSPLAKLQVLIQLGFCKTEDARQILLQEEVAEKKRRAKERQDKKLEMLKAKQIS
ncbi:hypothetical protein JFK97_18570 [Chromobacterium phragmitis]|uniref:hypothetical protein n=1 Tax=Chromobacterium amazonense TaxID=1382803 RepID=UPI0021B7C19F|nr:hypothetical protein [Chromobacterium amazonense]MBM2886398.1 hypothetical protein [Chromobacterium amazonense]MDE1714397.1 hypothetical protein [Chromobacterium amazonense]